MSSAEPTRQTRVSIAARRGARSQRVRTPADTCSSSAGEKSGSGRGHPAQRVGFVLVQPEMERGRSPLAGIAPFLAGQSATPNTVRLATRRRLKLQTSFKKEIRLDRRIHHRARSPSAAAAGRVRSMQRMILKLGKTNWLRKANRLRARAGVNELVCNGIRLAP